MSNRVFPYLSIYKFANLYKRIWIMLTSALKLIFNVLSFDKEKTQSDILKV